MSAFLQYPGRFRRMNHNPNQSRADAGRDSESVRTVRLVRREEVLAKAPGEMIQSEPGDETGEVHPRHLA
jgi:hypothetical protein